MGTRADFYVGRGKEMEWIGSIAMDGYPSGPWVRSIADATTEQDYRDKFKTEIVEKDTSVTTPDMGWPWPWDDSRTTDYAYSFFDGQVWGSNWGREWWPVNSEPDHEEEDGEKQTDWPDMSARKNVTFGPRSGLIVITGPKRRLT